jgi:hypothetical protein
VEPDGHDPQAIARRQICALNKRYDQWLCQTEKIRWLAVGAALIGLIFFLVPLLMPWSSRMQEYEDLAPLALGSGVALEALAAVIFYVYRKMLTPLPEMQMRLERMQRYLLAISVCDRAEENVLSNTLAELVRAISGSAPIGS